MKIILLSGGSGKRLWPLSNDARSKQFLKVLKSPDGTKESIIQRVVRQITTASLTEEITIATGANQQEAIEIQLGDTISVVTEPCRRDTFPAIMLATAFLASKGTTNDEPVIVMPCDSFTDDGYFTAIGKMAEAINDSMADIVLMGIEPTYPSTKYGYIVPNHEATEEGVMPVKKFTEKPDVQTAQRLIAEGALWNGGVFGFRLGYLIDIAIQIMKGLDLSCSDDRDLYATILANYAIMPKISFDYAIVEKAKAVAVVPYSGQWKDLGTWNVLTEELSDIINGDVVAKECVGSYMINELGIPMVCIGSENMVIAATPDGILVTDRNKSEYLKDLIGSERRPMCEHRTWGEYRIIDCEESEDGFISLTKKVSLEAEQFFSYQYQNLTSQILTIIDGEGEFILKEEKKKVKRGDVIEITHNDKEFALRATTPLTFIEVQTGWNIE